MVEFTEPGVVKKTKKPTPEWVEHYYNTLILNPIPGSLHSSAFPRGLTPTVIEIWSFQD
jgi:hypothetical protein